MAPVTEPQLQGQGNCPLCGRGNQCAMAGAGGEDASACWCMNTHISAQALEALAQQRQAQPSIATPSCLCLSCAAGQWHLPA
ncbi:cysteine-rich CWC family protein [Lampropedia hyalina]|uniref:cysteine-rich CWC family protein n=1 Tax=Lampropedia hyalina TaxID=198706 RepID=UPI000933106E